MNSSVIANNAALASHGPTSLSTPITYTATSTITGDYRLQITSPAIDAGNSLSVTVTSDLDNHPRKVVTNSIGQVSAPDLTTITVQPVIADLSLSLTDGKDYAIIGDSITYTLVVMNAGPDPVSGALVTDTLPGTISGVT